MSSQQAMYGSSGRLRRPGWQRVRLFQFTQPAFMGRNDPKSGLESLHFFCHNWQMYPLSFLTDLANVFRAFISLALSFVAAQQAARGFCTSLNFNAARYDSQLLRTFVDHLFTEDAFSSDFSLNLVRKKDESWQSCSFDPGWGVHHQNKKWRCWWNFNNHNNILEKSSKRLNEFVV